MKMAVERLRQSKLVFASLAVAVFVLTTSGRAQPMNPGGPPPNPGGPPPAPAQSSFGAAKAAAGYTVTEWVDDRGGEAWYMIWATKTTPANFTLTDQANTLIFAGTNEKVINGAELTDEFWVSEGQTYDEVSGTWSVDSQSWMRMKSTTLTSGENTFNEYEMAYGDDANGESVEWKSRDFRVTLGERDLL